MADIGNMTLDPVTGTYKAKTTTGTTGTTGAGSATQSANQSGTGTPGALPYLADNNQGYLPLVQPKQTATNAATQTTNQGSQNVLQYAQNKVLNQAADPINAKANEMALNQMNNPNFGYNPQAQKANQLSNFDLQRSQTAQQFRQTNGDMGGSGEVQKNLLSTLMASDVGRANLENSLDMQAYQELQKNNAAALAAGNAQQKLNSDLNAQGIANLVSVSGAGEGTATRTAAAESQQATFEQDMAKMVASQDWQGAQANLDRNVNIAKQNNDIESQKYLQKQQLDYDKQKLTATQDFEGVQSDLDRAAAVAKQSNDIQAQKDVQERQIQADQIKLEKTQDWQGVQNSIDRQQATTAQDKTIASATGIAQMQVTAQAAMQKNEQAFNSLQNELKLAADAAAQKNDLATQKEMQQAQIAAENYRQGQSQDFTAVQSAYQRAFESNQADKQIAAQQLITDRQIELDKWKLTTTQDFTGVQNAIDRDQKAAMQSNDIAAQKATQQRQLAADQQQLDQTQNWQGVQADINRRQELALQQNSLGSQQAIVEEQLALDKWKQENGQQFTAQQNDFNRILQQQLQDSQQRSTATQAELDRNLQAQIAQGTIYIQDKQLAQQALQATNELEFKKQALSNGNDQASIDRAWNAAQNANQATNAVALKQMDITAQTNLMTLKGQIDSNQLMQSEDFEMVQNDVDRQLKLAMQNNDEKATAELTQQKATLDAQAQEAQNKFVAAQTTATQGWQTSERIDTQTYEAGQQYLDYSYKKALQADDVAGQQVIESMRENNALKMQTQDMDQQTKMAYLSAKLDEAKANKDVDRQEQIMTFQHTQELETLAAQTGYDEQKMRVQESIDSYLKQGDYANAKSMQQADFTFRAQEAAKDRSLEQFKANLTKSGLDFDMLQTAIDKGQIAPDAAVADLKQFMADTGIKIEPPDPLATQKEADAQYQEQLHQFSLTHPDMVKDSYDSKPGLLTVKKVLTDDGVKAFNQYLNSTVYGELTPDEQTAKDNEGYLPQSSFFSATVGQNVKVDTALRAPSGETVPPGKYTISEETDDAGRGAFKKATTTVKRYAVSEDGKTKVLLDTKESTSGHSLAEFFLNPLGGM